MPTGPLHDSEPGTWQHRQRHIEELVYLINMLLQETRSADMHVGNPHHQIFVGVLDVVDQGVFNEASTAVAASFIRSNNIFPLSEGSRGMLLNRLSRAFMDPCSRGGLKPSSRVDIDNDGSYARTPRVEVHAVLNYAECLRAIGTALTSLLDAYRPSLEVVVDVVDKVIGSTFTIERAWLMLARNSGAFVTGTASPALSYVDEGLHVPNPFRSNTP